MKILIQSFGYKHGIPLDANFIFDVRCLPNPYWEPKLTNLTGKDQKVINFLNSKNSVLEMQQNILDFLKTAIPKFNNNNANENNYNNKRNYINIAIGCTGGQHRSVYIVENIFNDLKSFNDSISIKHREIDN